MVACDDPKWAPGERVGAPVVVLHTTHGDVTLELYYKHAPKTCENFFELARRGRRPARCFTASSRIL